MATTSLEVSVSKPIFIGGTGRSGTTVLSKILGEHPSIFSLPWETQFIVASGGLLNYVRESGQDSILEQFLKSLRGRWFKRTIRPNTPQSYDAGLCDAVNISELEFGIFQFLQELSAESPDSDFRGRRVRAAQALISHLFETPMQKAGAACWCEKTPRNILYMDELKELFPEAKFVHIVRDGRDVVASMLSRKFWPIAPSPRFPETKKFRGPVTFEAAVAYWREMLMLAERVSEKIPSDSYLVVKLEDIVDRPKEQMGLISGFLSDRIEGTPFTDTPSITERAAHIGRWRAEFTDKQKKYFSEHAGDYLSLFGYSES